MESGEHTGGSGDLAACLVGRGCPCEITNEGLLAAERYLREHLQEYDRSAPLGSHGRFIAGLVSEALRASRVIFRTPSELR